ncbi:hypothetical protein [Nonomuraea sp. NPDC049158]|uniref:hypothetical protein n=1 Tax=Nonomuraea sp. NPDC049158 TaxID=3155649 RepID=UPI0033D4CA3D
MSGWVDVHYQALEECGKQARKVANMLDLDDPKTIQPQDCGFSVDRRSGARLIQTAFLDTP